MAIGAPKDISELRKFFLEPQCPKQRQYEALRAYFVDGRPSAEVARDFGYTESTFHVMCHDFRREGNPVFFVTPKKGPKTQPKKSAAHDLAVSLRKQNYSIYEISEELKEKGFNLGATAVRELLKDEGFSALPRRLDDEKPKSVGPVIEAVADVRSFSLTPRRFTTSCGGLFLFIPDMVRLNLDEMASAADLPGSKIIPPAWAMRAELALKLWSIERKSHVMSLLADEGLGLFAGLNVMPKKSYLSEYSSRIDHAKTMKFLASWHAQAAGDPVFQGESFNLDFHSAPFYGEDPMIERHYVSMRSRRQPSILVFLAQDAATQAFCYSNADLRKGEEPEEVFHFIDFWKHTHGKLPAHLVFDSKLTTYDGLARIDKMGIPFITLRRRSASLLEEIRQLPASAWRVAELDVPTRKYKAPRYYERAVTLSGAKFRQLFIIDLGHEEPTVLLTNEPRTTAKSLITRYAQRMLIENSLSDAVRFFHMNALSSAVGLKVDFDMALLVVASGLYHLLAGRMRGYADAHARQVFRDIVDMPATVTISDSEIEVDFHRRTHLPIVIASGLLDKPVSVPWWEGKSLRLTTRSGS
jgi:transposase